MDLGTFPASGSLIKKLVSIDLYLVHVEFVPLCAGIHHAPWTSAEISGTVPCHVSITFKDAKLLAALMSAALVMHVPRPHLIPVLFLYVPIQREQSIEGALHLANLHMCML